MDREKSDDITWLRALTRGGMIPLWIIVCHTLIIAWSGTHELSADEARYAWAVSQPWDGMLAWLKTDAHPPLFLSLLKVWSSLFGISEFALRSMNVLFAAPLVLLVARFLKRYFPKEEMIALILFATNPLLIFLLGIAKYYMAFMLVCFAATVLFFRIRDAMQRGKKPGGNIVALWFVACAILPWMHYLGAVPLAIFALLLIRCWRSPAARVGLLTLLAGAATFLPWLVVLGGQLASNESRATIGVAALATKFAVRAGYAAYALVIGPSADFTNPIFLLGGIACAVILFLAIRRQKGISVEGPVFRLGMIGFASACTSLLIMMLLIPNHPDLSMPERLSFVLPHVVIVLGLVFAGLHGRSRLMLMAGYGGLCALSIFHTLMWDESNAWDYVIPWRQIARDVQSDPTALVIFDSDSFGALGWYYLRDVKGNLVEFRDAREQGKLKELRREAEQRSVTIIRNARDGSPERAMDALVEELDKAGLEKSVTGYVHDSAGMAALKKFLRRGSGEATHDSKVLLIRYRPIRTSSSSF